MNAAGAAVMTDWNHDIDYLEEADFRRVATFILSATGIRLSESKKAMMEGRIRRRAKQIGIRTIGEYLAMVFDDEENENEAINLIDAMTTNKTDFFREPSHFQYLSQAVFPELVKEMRTVKLWSAACSIGAEPYTLAMVASDFAKLDPRFRFQILASDISTEVLSVAVRAVFDEAMIEPVPMLMRQCYLLRSSDPRRKTVRIAPEIRAQVRFARINLVEDKYPVDTDVDVIFCRNLLIYFDRDTQEAVVRQLCAHLRPGGYLILGHADSISGMILPLTSCGSSIFRRA